MIISIVIKLLLFITNSPMCIGLLLQKLAVFGIIRPFKVPPTLSSLPEFSKENLFFDRISQLI